MRVVSLCCSFNSPSFSVALRSPSSSPPALDDAACALPACDLPLSYLLAILAPLCTPEPWVPSPGERYRQLLVPLLRVVAAVLAAGARNEAVARQALDLLATHGRALGASLKGHPRALSPAPATEMALVRPRAVFCCCLCGCDMHEHTLVLL